MRTSDLRTVSRKDFGCGYKQMKLTRANGTEAYSSSSSSFFFFFLRQMYYQRNHKSKLINKSLWSFKSLTLKFRLLNTIKVYSRLRSLSNVSIFLGKWTSHAGTQDPFNLYLCPVEVLEVLFIQTGDGERTQEGSEHVPTGCAMNVAEHTGRRSSLTLIQL